MTVISLKPEQTRAIAAHLAHFKGYLKTDQFRADQEERQRRVAFFREQLPDRQPNFSEADLTELVTLLWATSTWCNKQYHAQQIIAENGIDKLRQELQGLLYPAVHLFTSPAEELLTRSTIGERCLEPWTLR